MTHNKDILLARYFGGVCTKQEMDELELWIAASAHNQHEFDDMTKLYEQMSTISQPIPKTNAKEAKSKFLAHISQTENKAKTTTINTNKSISFNKKWLSIAAVAIIAIGISIAFVKFEPSEYEVVLATTTVVKADSLPDNTKVALSENSKISYSSNYGKKERKIKLEGEATFEVGHAGNGTLQISAQETFIEDIGTVFTVKALPESNFVSVKVSKGQVRFFTKSNEGIMLAANETGIYDKQTKTFKIETNKLDTLVANGLHVQFQGMILKDVFNIISKAYKVKINFEQPEIAKRKITVNFDGEDLNLVLQIIAETLDLKIKKDNNEYTLSNKTNHDEISE